MLDDLRWLHTTAAPDAALAMDNGAVGVIALGALSLNPVSPGWNILPLLPPYCTTAECGEIFTNLEAATAPRLKAFPEQQMLNVSNQVDNVQRNTTLFASTADFVNTARASQCVIQGTNGIRSFLRASSTSIHGQVTTNNIDQAIIGGTRLRDWLGDAMSSPDTVIDKIATGDLETTVSGVDAFPCTVGLAERRVPRRLGRAGHPGDRHVARLGGDALQPAAHRRVRPEVEAGLVRHVRVGVERDVGDRVALADEAGARRQVRLHHAERRDGPSRAGRGSSARRG